MPRIAHRTPLAWCNLTHRLRHLAVALAGVGFGVLLMFMEVGFQNALFDSTVALARALDADIILVSEARYTLSARQTFDLSRVHLAHSCAGVEAAEPVYLERKFAIWRRPGFKGYPIRVIAFDLARPVLTSPEVFEVLGHLDRPQTALIDLKSKTKFAFPPSPEELIDWQGAELAGRSLRLVGSFRLGTDFVNDGNLIMSATNFERFFRHRGRGARPLQNVDVGVVQVREGRDPETIRRQLRGLLPGDVSVYTKEEFIDREIRFWNESTPIGFIFSVSLLMGIVIGGVICFQIIHSTNAAYVKEFATLKAIGYQPRYFISLVFWQSLYLSLLGFVPGLIASAILYFVLSQWTGLLMMLTVKRVVLVLLLTVIMCTLSGALAMRKVLASDPADLY